MRKYKEKLKKSVVNQSFHIISFFIISLIAIIIVFVYSNTLKIIKNHAVEENAAEAKSVCKLTDTIIKQSETTVNLLSIDNTIKEYFTIRDLSLINSSVNSKIKSKVQQITFVNNYVSSCYFYTADNGFFYDCRSGDSDNKIDQNDIKSRMLNFGDEERFDIYPVSYSGKYPYYIRFLKQFDYSGRRCAIVLNLNIIELIKFINLKNIYIVYDEKVMYSDNIDEIFRPVKNDALLNKFYSEGKKSGILKYDDTEVIVSSAPSEKYDWEYISYSKLDGYYKQLTQRKILLYVFIIIILLIGGIIMFLHRWGVNKSLKYVSNIIEFPEIASGKTDNKIIEEISDKIFTYINVNKQLKYELEEKIVENKNLYFKVRQLQINPHFMFNILNSINICNMEGNIKETSQLILKLAKYMRYVLENEDDFISIEKELKNTKTYLELLQMRYPILKEINISVSDNLKDKNIIKFCLQPIVENSVYHGISKLKDRDGIISIDVFKEKNILKIVVKDNGIGIEEERLREIIQNIKGNPNAITNNHIGLKNVYQRLKIMDKNNFDMEITSKFGFGTTVTLTFPLI